MRRGYPPSEYGVDGIDIDVALTGRLVAEKLDDAFQPRILDQSRQFQRRRFEG